MHYNASFYSGIIMKFAPAKLAGATSFSLVLTNLKIVIRQVRHIFIGDPARARVRLKPDTFSDLMRYTPLWICPLPAQVFAKN